MDVYKELLEPVQNFLISIGIELPNWITSIILLLLTTLIVLLIKTAWKFVTTSYSYIKNSRDLHPYYTKFDIIRVRKFYIKTRIRDKPPSDYDNMLKARTIDIDVDAMEWFSNVAFSDEDDTRFYLVLSDSGMGKTTFLINLYIEYSKKLFRKYDIKLFPIGHPQSFKDIEEIIKSGKDRKTILLLDAFDEDNKALKDWKDRFESIIDAVQNFRQIVITSRTQFFPSEMEEPYMTKIRRSGIQKGFYSINKMYVSPFSKNDITLYLNKKYGKFNLFNSDKKNRAKKIISQSPNLMLRPMLLAYIEDLLESSTKYKYTYQIYEELIVKWISREADRVESTREDQFRENLNKFSSIIAREIYKNFNSGREGLILSEKEIDEIALQYDIDLHSLEMKSKSLLNRNVIGQYKFSHKSILEFLLAKQCMIDDDFGSKFNFMGFDQAKKFVAEMSKVKYVLKFMEESGIQTSSGYYDIKIANTKTKRYLKTLNVNRKQLINLLIKLDDNRFAEGLNELLYQNIIILKDSQHYKIENIAKIETLKRVTIYTNFHEVRGGKICQIEKHLPNCYIPRWGFK